MRPRTWKLTEWLIAAAIGAIILVVIIRRTSPIEFFAAASASYCWFRAGTKNIAIDFEKILLARIEHRPTLLFPGGPPMQQQIIATLSQALTKALQKVIPDLPSDGATQINTLVSGLVGLVWDIAKLEGAKELARLNAADLVKLFPQLASFIPAQSV